jgi:predicted DNA-binding protein (MmcQ/YjbR family)
MTDIDTLRSRCAALPGATEDFPFGADTLVLKVSGKIFAMTGMDEVPLRLTLKGDPDDNEALRSLYPAIQPGYYMNKRHWNTVTLDGTVPADVLDELIVNSHALVVRGLPRAARLRFEACK